MIDYNKIRFIFIVCLEYINKIGIFRHILLYECMSVTYMILTKQQIVIIVLLTLFLDALFASVTYQLTTISITKTTVRSNNI